MLWKKILSAALAGALMATLLLGCGKGDEKAEVKTADAGEDTKQMVGNMYVFGLPIVKEPMTFDMAVGKHVLSKNNYQEKVPIKFMEEKTNVKINWMEIPTSGWSEKVNIMFASGDLPDAFMGSVSIAKSHESLAKLNDLIDKYAPSTKALFEQRADIKKGITLPDGSIYSLPKGEETPWTSLRSTLWINKEWLSKLELEMPQTTDDLYNILKAFKEKDPNGNGKQDEIPLLFSQAEETCSINSMFGSFGVLENNEHLMVRNGKIVFAPTELGYYDALRYFHKLYAEGLMDLEGFSQNQAQLIAKGKSKETIAGLIINFLIDNVVGADRINDYPSLQPLKGPNGDSLWDKRRSTGMEMQSFVITSRCKNPEVLVRWFDYACGTLENSLLWSYGKEGDSWQKRSDGTWEVLDSSSRKGFASFDEYRYTIAAGTPGASRILLEDNLKRYFKPDSPTQRKVNALKAYEPYFPKEVLPVGLEDPNIVQERAILFADIDSYVKNFMALSIMKGVNDKQWQEHLDKCKSLKTDQYVKMYQDFYDRVKN